MKTNNGIELPNKEYRAKDGVSSTDLKRIAKSPAHFRYWKDNPQGRWGTGIQRFRSCYRHSDILK